MMKALVAASMNAAAYVPVAAYSRMVPYRRISGHARDRAQPQQGSFETKKMTLRVE